MLRNVTLRQSFAFGSLFLAMVPLWSACSSTVEGTGGNEQTETGGDASVGGTSSGGSSDGGNSAGGSSDGGSSAGGSSDGGSSAGGASTGGASTGGASTGGAATGGNGTGGDSGPTPPSCEGLSENCGPDGTDSCCTSIALAADPFPMGRSSSGTDEAASGETNEQPEHTATLIAGVKLDKYEVSVGRFRKFVEGYPGNKPEKDDGQHVGQGLSGWQTAWDTELPEGQEDLIWDVGPGCGNGATWFDEPVEVSAYGNTELRPIVCVNWYVAFAFCAWDGGFLPSEADWEYAAAGGSENRLYPWGDDAPTKNLAAFDCKYDGITPDCGYSTANDPWSDLTAVGTITGGVGRFGHFDLAGNVDEWVMDGYSGSYYSSTACNNCINLTDTTERVLRGGSYWSTASEIRAAARRSARPEQGTIVDSDIDWSMGFRCARAE